MKKISMRYSKADNCYCNICARITKVIKVEYYTQDFASNTRYGKICKRRQKHPQEIWICPKCMHDIQREAERLKSDPSRKAWEELEG